MYYEVCCCLHVKCSVYKHLTHEYTLGHLSLSVCEVHTYPLGCLRYTEKQGKDILISCGCVLLATHIGVTLGAGLGLLWNGHDCMSTVFTDQSSIVLQANVYLVQCSTPQQIYLAQCLKF